MEEPQSPSLDQWGTLDWDDELEELCTASTEEAPEPIDGKDCEMIGEGSTRTPISKLECNSEPTEDCSNRQTDVRPAVCSSHYHDTITSSDHNDKERNSKQVSSFTSRIPTPPGSFRSHASLEEVPELFTTNNLDGHIQSSTNANTRVSKIPTPKASLARREIVSQRTHDLPTSHDSNSESRSAGPSSAQVSRIPAPVSSFGCLGSAPTDTHLEASRHDYDGGNQPIEHDTTHPYSSFSPITGRNAFGFAPGHPGWAEVPSPPVTSRHSTSPEVNCWVNSVPIYLSLNNILDAREDCPGKAAVVLNALLLTDDEDFGGFKFPHGALGWKTPLPVNFLPWHSQQPRRSLLSNVETLDYSAEEPLSSSSVLSSYVSPTIGVDSDNIDFDEKPSEDPDGATKAIHGRQESKCSQQKTTESYSEVFDGGKKLLHFSVTEEDEIIQDSLEIRDQVLPSADEVPISDISRGPDEEVNGTGDDHSLGQNDLLEVAVETPLPGFDLVDEFLDSSSTAPTNPLESFLDLADQLEVANEIMEKRLKEVERQKEEEDKTEKPARDDFGKETAIMTNDGGEIGKTEQEEESLTRVSAMRSSMNDFLGFCRELLKGLG